MILIRDKKKSGNNMSGVHKAKPILTNQTVAEIFLRKFHGKQTPASSQTNPTTHSAGAPARQFPTSNPQTRRSLTVSSRRGLPARGLLKRGPTFPCGGRYRRPQRAPIRARPCSGNAALPSARRWLQNSGTAQTTDPA